jgi:hypothetical protein
MAANVPYRPEETNTALPRPHGLGCRNRALQAQYLDKISYCFATKKLDDPARGDGVLILLIAPRSLPRKNGEALCENVAPVPASIPIPAKTCLTCPRKAVGMAP